MYTIRVPPALLLTDYVTPQIAKLLRDAGTAFADAAGNAYLEFAGDLLYVTGNTPEPQPRTEKVVRAFQTTGLRVVFALLCALELVAQPTRQLAAMLGVANGTVARVIDDLAHLGFLTTIGRRGRRLRNLKGLLERWVMMYPVHLRPTLLRRRLTTDEPHWWKTEKFDAQLMSSEMLFQPERSRPQLIKLSPIVHHEPEIDVARRFAGVYSKAQPKQECPVLAAARRRASATVAGHAVP